MNLEIIEQEESMLPKTTYTVKGTYQGPTPSRKDVKKKISVMVDSAPESVVVRSFQTGLGSGKLIFTTDVYSDEHAKNLLVNQGMLARNHVEESSEEE